MKFSKAFGVSLAAAALALVGAANASADDHQVTVKVPFNFTAGDAKLPAGQYTISTVGDDASMLAIRSLDGQKSAYLLTSPRVSNDPSAPPQLVFERVNEEYVLSQLTLESTGGHRTVVAPARIKHEREPILASR